MIKIKQHLSILIVVACLSIAVWHLGHATWIYGKAYAATFLINNAWQKALANNEINKPWSWADTWPVAKISIPKIGLSEIVLSGDSGAVLAFGPGLSHAGATLDSDHVKLISAHRDTHFSKLKKIVINDDIYIKTSIGSKRYSVTEVKVVDSRSYTIDAADDTYDLVLVTCYPFDSIASGGYQRFVVKAQVFDGNQQNHLSYSQTFSNT